MKPYYGILGFLGIFSILGCNSTEKSNSSTQNSFRITSTYKSGQFNSLKEVWKFQTGSAIRATPLVVDDIVLIGSSDSNFYSINKNGKEVWRFKAAAAIESSAAGESGQVYFTDRANNLYALSITNGKLLWKLQLGQSLQYDWGFDYYQSSPLAGNNTVFVGSGDGNLYAIETTNGTIKWKFNAGSLIRSSASLANNSLYFGDCSGKLYALDPNTGNKKWEFHTIGDTLKNEEFGFDRKAIIASPVIKDNLVVVGSRDGYMYAIDASTGKEKWEFNYDVSWVISTVAIQDSFVVAGTSDGRFVNAINLKSGKEIWRSPTNLVWSSPIIISNIVVTPANDGFIYLHELSSGKEISRNRAGTERFFSSPVFENNTVYVGNDDGYLYALNVTQESPKSVLKSVFWIKDPIYQYHKSGLDAYIKDFFVSEGYQLLDENKLNDFLGQRIKDNLSSVIVLATNYFPEGAITGGDKNNLVYKYLNSGGKIVATGLNPAVFSVDFKNKQFQGYDYSLSEGITGLAYPQKDLRSHKGFYSSGLTNEGSKWGLSGTVISNSSVDPKLVLPLAIDENGNAAYWVKQYGGKKGTGFLQLWINRPNLGSVHDLKMVAEYGY